MEEKRMLVMVIIGLAVLVLFYGWCFTEKHARVKKWGWWSIGLLTLAFAIFTVWYHTPAVCRDHVQVVEVNSRQEATVEVELIVQRSYLRGTRISGWICTPVDTYGASYISQATREDGSYRCSTLFRADTMASEPSFDDCVYHVCVDFSRGFESVTYLEMIERRQSDDETYWYTTPAKP